MESNRSLANAWGFASETGENLKYWVSATLLLILLISLTGSVKRSFSIYRLPCVNWKWTELSYARAKKQFTEDGITLILDGLKKFQAPFVIITGYGPKIIIPSQQIDEILELDRQGKLDFAQHLKEENLGYIPGLDVFGSTELTRMDLLVRTKITQNLAKFTQSLADETIASLNQEWGSSSDWIDISVKKSSLSLVSKMSARVFVGEELCREKEWRDLMSDYTMKVLEAGHFMRQWPSMLHSIVHWFNPQCIRARANLQRAREMLNPIIAQRRRMRQSKQYELDPDAIDWMEEIAQGNSYDAAMGQVLLAFAAIHTSTDLLSQAVINLCKYPKWFDILRKEVETVVETDKWEKTSLNKMQLLDSFVKETQRLKPLIGPYTMNRCAVTGIRLSDGTYIPKGARLAVSSTRLWDPEIYEDPETFNPLRFHKLRQDPNLQYRSHLIATSPEYMPFSHGKYACPGRYFAANEMKVALAQMILHFDLRLKDPSNPPRIVRVGAAMIPDPSATIEVRRRS